MLESLKLFFTNKNLKLLNYKDYEEPGIPQSPGY